MPGTDPDPETLQPDTAIDLDGEDDDDEEENDDFSFEPATPHSVKLKMDTLVRLMLTGPVPVHVHDVTIKGNTNIKGDIIGAEALEALKKATTMQDLLRVSDAVNSRLKSLGLFDSVTITLDSGPPEIPGRTNVIIEIEEAKNRLSGKIGAYTKAEAKSSSVVAPVTVRAYIYQNLEYHLAWRNLAEPSQTSSSSIRTQLGHDYLSSLKYTLNVDKRNSLMRPTKGFVFVAKTHINGLAPDSQTLRFLHQCGSHWPESLSVEVTTSLPEKFFLGGNLSPVCAFGGPKALWGFKTRASGSDEPTGQINVQNAIGGNFTVTALADLSFDLPSRSSAGIGIVIPATLFRMELNYCYILKKFSANHAKASFWLAFCHPS
ncbi:hypothetical protein V6N11_038597 [Hibiscus sabdariffa]|uniref:POTRA domain-containing protein n=1 Tax=Hibiscus sabdariffa TaxID=183260 RepID=A0ABR2SKG5_9ROSI